MAQKTIKILIVDDKKEFLSMIVDLIRSVQKNLRIKTARSGKECLQMVKDFHPELVFLDIGMDGMNGLVTLRFIKSLEKNARLFFLSGHPVEFIKDAAGW
jgi:CheY-like chemotaxis protein